MAGKAQFRIEGDDATARAFNSVVARAQQTRDKIQGFMNSAFVVTGVTAFLGKITEVGHAAIELGDNLNKAAIKAGIGGKEISQLAYAAKLADVDLTALSTSLKKMQVFVSEASSGNKEAISTLHALGLEIADLKGKKADEQFELFADQVNRLASAEDKARAVTAVFGKAGADLLPLFEQGAAGIAAARKEAERLGYSFSDDTLSKLAEADDQVKRLSASWEAYGITLTKDVLPPLNNIINASQRASQEGVLATAKRYLSSPLGFLYDSFSGSGTSNDEYDRNRRGTINRHEIASPIGFAAQDQAEEAAKAAAAAEKEMQKFLDGYHDSLHDINAQVDRESDASLEKDLNRWMQREDASNEFYERWKKSEQDLTVYREQQAAQTAALFRDTFLAAWDDWINTGKFKFDEFLKYLVAQWARAEISKAFSNMFSSGSSSDSDGSIIGSIVGAIGSAFTGGGASVDGKASGGPVRGGQSYLVGERGMELFTPTRDGTIVPNHALGGGGVNITNYIQISGASTVTHKELQQGLREASRQTFDELDRRGVMRNSA